MESPLQKVTTFHKKACFMAGLPLETPAAVREGQFRRNGEGFLRQRLSAWRFACAMNHIAWQAGRPVS